MRPRLHQAPATVALLGVALGMALVLAGSAAPAAAPPGGRRAQLRSECDALLRAAVKTPFGWGWRPGAVPPDSEKTGPHARGARTPARAAARAAGPVTIDTRTTAAAGLALHLAGQRLGEPGYSEAAVQAARVLAAVQSNTGQVPTAGIIRARAGGNDEPALVPSRAATSSSLALWLTLLHDAAASTAGPEAEAGAEATRLPALRPAVLKAANWLAKQQTKLGGWPVEYAPTPAESRAKAAPSASRPIRLLRLDRPDGRDATFCLWLSAQVLGDANLRRRAEAAVEELSALRIADEKSPARNLWAPAYNLDESPLQDVNDLPYGVDTAATDYAMQALLAASLLGDADAAGPVLEEATAALNRLPRRDGQWLHDYGLSSAAPTDASGEGKGKETPERANQGLDAPPESQVFVPGADGEKKETPAAPPSLAQTVAAAKRLTELGPQKYAEALAATTVPVEHRLALAVCGLDEDALAREVPTDDKGIEQYMQQYRGPFSLLDSPPPDDLATRVQRLGLLLRLVRIESGSNHHDH